MENLLEVYFPKIKKVDKLILLANASKFRQKKHFFEALHFLKAIYTRKFSTIIWASSSKDSYRK